MDTSPTSDAPLKSDLRFEALQPELQVEIAKLIYTEAGLWARLANTVIWTVGTVFVTGAFGAIPLAIQKPDLSYHLGALSIVLFWSWWWTYSVYAFSAVRARDVAINLEKFWEFPKDQRLYFGVAEVIRKGALKWAMFGVGIALSVFWVSHMWRAYLADRREREHVSATLQSAVPSTPSGFASPVIAPTAAISTTTTTDASSLTGKPMTPNRTAPPSPSK